MANSYFQFKQFTIYHDKCAMKVGTDGVLLGAWANTESCKNILDIGTGTGLIALMLAQRSNALIDAIDINKEACLQAMDNVAASPFAGRIRTIHTDFTDYSATCTSRYDLIVSNPPYFVNSLKCPNINRNTARHTDTLSIPDLVKSSRMLLSSSGRIALILPFELLDYLSTIAKENNLYINKRTDIIPVPGASPKRFLVELSESPNSLITEKLVIEEARHQYTKDYISLTKDFYLKM